MTDIDVQKCIVQVFHNLNTTNFHRNHLREVLIRIDAVSAQESGIKHEVFGRNFNELVECRVLKTEYYQDRYSLYYLDPTEWEKYSNGR